MNRLISQMPLGLRIKALAEAVRSTRAMKELNIQEEAALMDDLAHAEADVLAKNYGWEDAELSGLIADGENPHVPQTAHGAASAAAEPEAPEPATAKKSKK